MRAKTRRVARAGQTGVVGAALGTLVAPGPGTAAGAGLGGKLGESLRGLFSK